MEQVQKLPVFAPLLKMYAGRYVKYLRYLEWSQRICSKYAKLFDF